MRVGLEVPLEKDVQLQNRRFYLGHERGGFEQYLLPTCMGFCKRATASSCGCLPRGNLGGGLSTLRSPASSGLLKVHGATWLGLA